MGGSQTRPYRFLTTLGDGFRGNDVCARSGGFLWEVQAAARACLKWFWMATRV